MVFIGLQKLEYQSEIEIFEPIITIKDSEM
jgi:hypothetical protein